jgi:hypothetical protein
MNTSEHEWTLVNTDGTRVEHEWNTNGTQVNTNGTRVNTNGTRANTWLHTSQNTSEHKWTRMNTSEHEWNTSEHKWTRMEHEMQVLIKRLKTLIRLRNDISLRTGSTKWSDQKLHTSQNTSEHEWTQVNTNGTQVNTNGTQVNTNVKRLINRSILTTNKVKRGLDLI